MKRLCICLLSIVMVLTLTACGSSGKINYGGSIGFKDVSTLGKGMGTNYKETAVASEFDYELCDVHTFQDPNAIVRYVQTFRFTVPNSSIEKVAESENKSYGSCHVTFFEKDGERFACYPYDYFFEGDYYYGTSVVYYDKETDEYLEVYYSTSTDEVKLGDTGLYAFVPKGYTEGTYPVGDILNISYDDMAFNYTDMFAYKIKKGTSDSENFSFITKVWDGLYDGEFPFTEDQFSTWNDNGWQEADEYEYLGCFGEIIDTQYENVCGWDTSAYKVKTYNGKELCVVYLYNSDKDETIALMQLYTHERTASSVSLFLDSLHEVPCYIAPTN